MTKGEPISDNKHPEYEYRSRIFRAQQIENPDHCIILKDVSRLSAEDLNQVIRLREQLKIETEYLSRYLAFIQYNRDRMVTAATYADGRSFDRLNLRHPHETEDNRLLHAIVLIRGLIKVVGRLMELGVLHRDVKARNAMLLRRDAEGDKGGVGLIDIDFLTTLEAEEQKRREMEGIDEDQIPHVGTLHNISPEAAGRPERVKEEDKDKYRGRVYIFKDKRFSRTSDMFGVGITAMRLLGDPTDKIVGNRFELFNKDRDLALALRSEGRFFPQNLKDRLYGEVLPQYSDAVFLQARGMIEFILRATQTNPNDRPQSGEEALRILDGEY